MAVTQCNRSCRRARSALSSGAHPAYAEQLQKVFAVFSDPARAAHASSAEQIAAVVYEAATDDRDQLRYVAGEDAKAMYAQRQAAGHEAARKAIGAAFLGES